jgi:hypothetical protein
MCKALRHNVALSHLLEMIATRSSGCLQPLLNVIIRVDAG